MYCVIPLRSKRPPVLGGQIIGICGREIWNIWILINLTFGTYSGWFSTMSQVLGSSDWDWVR